MLTKGASEELEKSASRAAHEVGTAMVSAFVPLLQKLAEVTRTLNKLADAVEASREGGAPTPLPQSEQASPPNVSSDVTNNTQPSLEGWPTDAHLAGLGALNAVSGATPSGTERMNPGQENTDAYPHGKAAMDQHQIRMLHDLLGELEHDKELHRMLAPQPGIFERAKRMVGLSEPSAMETLMKHVPAFAQKGREYLSVAHNLKNRYHQKESAERSTLSKLAVLSVRRQA